MMRENNISEIMRNKAVWKYKLPITDNHFIEMPIGSKVLSADIQNDEICIWVEVFTEETKKEMKTLYLRGTGHTILVDESNKLKFIGTLLLRGGSIVFHLFELR
jgi:hypothetical protein